jgi:hypothetical protein
MLSGFENDAPSMIYDDDARAPSMMMMHAGRLTSLDVRRSSK